MERLERCKVISKKKNKFQKETVEKYNAQIGIIKKMEIEMQQL